MRNRDELHDTRIEIIRFHWVIYCTFARMMIVHPSQIDWICLINELTSLFFFFSLRFSNQINFIQLMILSMQSSVGDWEMF